MDFTWAKEDQNIRKQQSLLQKSQPIPSPLSSVRTSEGMENKQKNPHSRVSFTPDETNSSPLRRSRADTMPSQSSAFPYAPDIFTTLPPPPSLPALSNSASRNRSGSVTLPTDYQESHYSQTPFGYSPYDPSSPIDENASSTIASTLASLGLDDENNTLTSSSHFGDRHHPHLEDSVLPQSTSNRARSYTVGGSLMSNEANPNISSRPEISRLIGPFSPFSPQTRSSVMQRPRAISLGMADNPISNAFTPFDMTSTTNNTSSTSNNNNNNSSSSVLLRMHDSPILRSSRSSGNLAELNSDMYTRSFTNLDVHEEMSDQEYYSQPDGAESPSSAQTQFPSRALWLGNINPSLSVPDLIQLFSTYGQVESARILSDKECAFVNFITVDSAVVAKDDLETRLGSKLAGTPVRVGFGKADVSVAMALTNEAGPNAQGPTRALWVGNIPANMNPAILRTIFQAFGDIESVRVLSHKNCGFVNFDHQEDAVKARKMLQNKEILGPGTGAVRIGFAKVPPNNPDEAEELNKNQAVPDNASPTFTPTTLPTTPANTNNQKLLSTSTLPNNETNTGADNNYQAAQWATSMTMPNTMHAPSQQTGQPNLYTAIATERLFIMQQLGFEPIETAKADRIPLTYHPIIPAVPELSADRKLEPLRLREMRKRLENGGQQMLQEIEMVAEECMEEIVELCSDYIGNTIIQKLFEFCNDSTKLRMLEKIAPFLASIGVHKNGTWAAQKIIDFSNTPEQVRLVRQCIAPYVPLLLLDQFGNYVVQCCLRKGSEKNQYIFDAIVDKCWEIGQGRFGARAVRAMLENPIVTTEQRVYVAAAIVQNAVLLTTNANGVLLLTWFLDTSELSGRYRVLCPRFMPYLSKLSSHKLGSMTVQKIISQTQEADAASLLLSSLPEKTRNELLKK